MKTKILYLSYNGMLEPLGESQVLSYLYKLSADYDYYLISLEKPKDMSDTACLAKMKEAVANCGIQWHPLIYKEDKVGKIVNFFRLLNKTRSVIKKKKIRYVHCRSYFPALVALLLKKKYNLKYLFDTRGFAFDERADVGSIKRGGIIYDFFKRIEKKLYLNAAGVNKLSHEGKRTILENELFFGGDKVSPITVIPTCVDLDRFQFIERKYGERVKIGYVGTTIGWYDFDRTLKVVSEIGKQMDYHFTIFNGGQHDFIRQKLTEYNIPSEKVTLEKITFEEMPQRLAEMEVSVFYIYPFFSKRASAATKMGELLATGIPIITNGNVGDHEFYVQKNKTGKIIDFDKLEQYDFNKIIKEIRNEETSKRCREVAEKYFSVEKGVEDYKKLYSEIFV